MPKVVAISGWKYSGKDTVAKYLKETKDFSHLSFAKPLKDSVLEKYGLEPEQIVDLDLKEAPLLEYPVSPQDQFSVGIAKLLYGEFRTQGGSRPSDYHIDESGAFLGVLGRHCEQLYWTPRALMILEGSKERSVNPNHWVERLVSSIDSDGPNVVISDLRYQSEASALKEAFGKDLLLVRVNRFDECNSTDSSERDLDNYPFDVVLNNKGTLEELNLAIEETICVTLEEK